MQPKQGDRICLQIIIAFYFIGAVLFLMLVTPAPANVFLIGDIFLGVLIADTFIERRELEQCQKRKMKKK